MPAPSAAETSALTRQIASRRFGDSPAAESFWRMMNQESIQFDPRVVSGELRSPAGARGVAQLMPDHWRSVNPDDPAQALDYAATWYQSLITRYGGDLRKATAAYNWGPGNVDKAAATYGGNWEAHAPDETKLYLRVTNPGGNVDPSAFATASGAPARQPSPGIQPPRPINVGSLTNPSVAQARTGTTIMPQTQNRGLATVFQMLAAPLAGSNFTPAPPVSVPPPQSTTTLPQTANAPGVTGSAPSVPVRSAGAVSGLTRDATHGWQLPTEGAITSLFGEPFYMDSGTTYQGRSYAHFNKGIDIGAKPGAAVQSMTAGTVKIAGDDKAGWGPRVVVVDADGFEHSYGHLGTTHLKPGDKVEAGQLLGSVGAGEVGTSTGPHTSYDIRDPRTGEFVDPTPWLTGGTMQGASAVHPSIQHDPARAPRPASAQPVTSAPAAAGQSPAGGGQPVTMPAAGTPTGNSASLEQAANAALSRYNELVARQQELSGKVGRGEQLSQNEMVQFSTIGTDINNALKNYTDLAALVQKGGAAAGPTPLEVAQAGAGVATSLAGAQTASTNAQTALATATANAASTDFNNTVTWATTLQNMMHMGLTDQLGIANFLLGIMDLNTRNALAGVASRQAQGELELNAVNSQRQLIDSAQAAEVARFAAMMGAAGFISDTNYRNAMRVLPPGSDYQPGFEPNSPMNAVLSSLGIPPQTIRVNKMPVEQFDPVFAMQAANNVMTAGGWGNIQQPGTYEQVAANLNQTTARVAGIPPVDIPSINPQDPRFGLPQQAPNYGTLGEMVPMGTNTAGAFTGLSVPDNSQSLNALSQFLTMFQTGATTAGQPPAPTAQPPKPTPLPAGVTGDADQGFGTEPGAVPGSPGVRSQPNPAADTAAVRQMQSGDPARDGTPTGRPVVLGGVLANPQLNPFGTGAQIPQVPMLGAPPASTPATAPAPPPAPPPAPASTGAPLQNPLLNPFGVPPALQPGGGRPTETGPGAGGVPMVAAPGGMEYVILNGLLTVRPRQRAA